MKRWLLFLLAVFFLLALPDQAKACEPCESILSLEDTTAQADLVFIGRLAAEGPATDDGEGWGGPEWIEVDVVEVYKGRPSGERVRVHSWSGMCPYGIILNDQSEHLIFLQETSSGYDAVNYGCAVKQLSIEEGRVIIGDQALSIADLAANLGLDPRENLIDQTEIEVNPPEDQNDSGSPGLCAPLGVGIVLAPFMAVFWVRKKKNPTSGEDPKFP